MHLYLTFPEAGFKILLLYEWYIREKSTVCFQNELHVHYVHSVRNKLNRIHGGAWTNDSGTSWQSTSSIYCITVCSTAYFRLTFFHHDTIIFLSPLYYQCLKLCQIYFIFDFEDFVLVVEIPNIIITNLCVYFFLENYGERSNQMCLIILPIRNLSFPFSYFNYKITAVILPSY